MMMVLCPKAGSWAFTPKLLRNDYAFITFYRLFPPIFCFAHPIFLTSLGECSRRFMMVGAPPPPTIFRRAADVKLVFLIVLLHFSCFAWFRDRLLTRCEIEVYTSLARQFVPMSGLQNSILEEPILWKNIGG